MQVGEVEAALTGRLFGRLLAVVLFQWIIERVDALIGRLPRAVDAGRQSKKTFDGPHRMEDLVD
jgi:hypothetical protein